MKITVQGACYPEELERRVGRWAAITWSGINAGADAISIAELKVQDLQEPINANRDLSTSLAVGET